MYIDVTIREFILRTTQSGAANISRKSKCYILKFIALCLYFIPIYLDIYNLHSE